MTSESSSSELIELLRQTREYARYLDELGAETFESGGVSARAETFVATVAGQPIEAPSFPPAPLRKVPAPRAAAPAIQSLSKNTPASNSLFAVQGERDVTSTETLEEIWADIGECTRCALCAGRTQVVNTHGNRKARLMFVGEAPGADEDAQGKPFVGRAGQLLTKMIEAMGMKREDVIIGNVNRCRPPGNRQPTLEEAAICRPFLFREIATVRPEVIVVMGNTAVHNLLEIRAGISSVRGQFRDYQGIKVMPTFHPAYLLRDPSKKRETWEDLKKVMDYLDNSSRSS
jgi:uracil-DNA glycosylase family 4